MRRDFGSGSVARYKNGRFQARLRVVIDGRPERVSLGYAATRRDAIRLINEGRKRYYDAADHKLPRGAAHTVESFTARWLEKAIKPGRRSTHRTYEAMLRLYVLPVIGPKRLDGITRGDVDDVQRYAHDKGVSPTTISLMLTVLGAMLRHAMDKEELISRNVVAGCDRLYRGTPRRYQFLAPEDVPAMLSAVEPSPYANLYSVLLFTGLRIGEALALRWTDVDLDRATLRVEHSMATVDGKRVLGEPKTQKARRAVDLPPEAVAALSRQRKLQMVEQARAGAAGVPWLNPHGLIFTASYGSPASDSTVRKEFYRLLTAAGLPPMRLHDLRHSCATIELAAGAPLVAVSEQLGHAKPSITLNVYAHAVPSMRQAVAEAMHRALQS